MNKEQKTTKQAEQAIPVIPMRITKGRGNSAEGWCGTHCGSKRGKVFPNPGNPDKKALRRLKARQEQHANGLGGTPGYEKKTTHGRQIPGSMKKVC